MSHQSYEIRLPLARSCGVVFASPHSGCDYPADFVAQSQLSLTALRSSEDAHVDRLFEGVVACGAPLLAARLPRAFVDLNRSADDLDPAVIEGIARSGHNPRILSGLGVIPRVVSAGRVIRAGRISRSEAEARLRLGWYPYHAALRGLLQEARGIAGRALLVDCHSMPHEALVSHFGKARDLPQIVLGDRHGAAADPDLVEAVEAAFRDAGFRVVHNAPFAGAYVSQAYGQPSARSSVIQVEIDRALYMNEATIEPHVGFADIAAALSQASARICALLPAISSSLAAE
jgi:N-formylglutamate amidohydrolase